MAQGQETGLRTERMQVQALVTPKFIFFLFKQRHLVCLIKAFTYFPGSEKTRSSKIGKQFFFAQNAILKHFPVHFPNRRKSYVKDSELSFKKSQKSGRDCKHQTSDYLTNYCRPISEKRVPLNYVSLIHI